ncbi:hypothetical protein [Lutibacter citreus]|uniref:hypothetical protein n=1 Tax=Lutibacter citreus TaxID=2138210 RepID=UPI001300B21D|nr:hypothetical protein [Lutibacter citreus]
MGAVHFSGGFFTGYNRGLGFQANLTAHKPLESSNVDIRFGIGYTSLNPGNSSDARRIFINNATNGVPKEKGKSFDYRIDVLVPASIFNFEESYFIFGPRYSSFRANFKYIGGNEDFDVTSKQFGLGIGAESHFKMNAKLDFVLTTGLDYYLNATLNGHDTSYSVDNDNVNPRNDNQNGNVSFNYKDADKSINQPQLMPRFLIGFNYKL